MAIQLMERVQRWDDRLFERMFLGSEGKKIRRKIFYAFSRSADGPWYLLLAGSWMVLESNPIRWILAGSSAFALDLLLYFILKKNIGRPRPYRKFEGVRFLIAPPDEFSFPSGHTAAAFLVAALVSVSFPFLSAPFLVWAALVGFSRVYLGVHYPTDVLVGMVLGLCCAGAGLWWFGL